MRIAFLFCLVLFSCCGERSVGKKTPDPTSKSKEPVTADDYRRFFGQFCRQWNIDRVDPREQRLTALDSDEPMDLSDTTLLTHFTKADIRFMHQQQSTKRKKDLSDYLLDPKLIGAQEADSLIAVPFGEFFQPNENGFYTFSRPLFSVDKLTVLLYFYKEFGNYYSERRTAIWHWDGKDWKEVKFLDGTTW